jgi:hypothetical protein
MIKRKHQLEANFIKYQIYNNLLKLFYNFRITK